VIKIIIIYNFGLLFFGVFADLFRKGIFNSTSGERKAFIKLAFTLNRWKVIFVLILIFYEKILFVVLHEKSKIVVLLSEVAREIRRKFASVLIL